MDAEICPWRVSMAVSAVSRQLLQAGGQDSGRDIYDAWRMFLTNSYTTALQHPEPLCLLVQNKTYASRAMWRR